MYSITSKGQITIPKEFRKQLRLDTLDKATIHLNEHNEIITVPKNLSDVRTLLSKPTFKDSTSEKEQAIGSLLAKQYGIS